MSIFADIELIVSVLKEVDQILGTLPQNAEIVKIKSKLDSALAAIAPLGF